MMCDPIGWHYSLGVGAAVGIAPGTIYPVFAKLEKADWVESRWDSGGEAVGPRRRLYRLTGAGQRIAAEVLAERSLDPSPPRPRRRYGFGLPKPTRGVV